MSLSPAAIRAMRAAGLSSDQILDVIEKAGEERLAKVREGNRRRQAAYKARHKDESANASNADNDDDANNAVRDVTPVTDAEPSRACSNTNLPSGDIFNTPHIPPKTTKREPRNRGTRIPLDFAPSSDCLKFAHSLGFSTDLELRTRAEFVDFWIGVPGSKGLKLDWLATYRNRLREVAGRMKLRPGGAAVLPFAVATPPPREELSPEEMRRRALEFDRTYNARQA